MSDIRDSLNYSGYTCLQAAMTVIAECQHFDANVNFCCKIIYNFDSLL